MEDLCRLVDNHLGTLPENSIKKRKWKISDNTQAGRGILADEDINVGETILVDIPLVYGPRNSDILPRGCTVCCKIDTDDIIKCPLCSLRLCSVTCQQTETHQKDCSVIQSVEAKVQISDVPDAALSKALAPFRSLHLSFEGKSLLRNLQANVFPQHGSEIRELKDYFNFNDDDEKFMNLACCVLDANAFQIATSYGKNVMSLRGLYPVASLLNHSCVPNTGHVFNDSNKMSIKAVRFIPAGSEIFTCYTSLLWGTPARRHHLYKTKHFGCNCDRCKDPTEHQTFIAALKCFSKTCNGHLLPIDPLNLKSKWQCTECFMNVLTKYIGSIQSALGSLLGTLNFDDPVQIEDFIVSKLSKYIPKTNQIFLDLKYRLIRIIGEIDGYKWSGE